MQVHHHIQERRDIAAAANHASMLQHVPVYHNTFVCAINQHCGALPPAEAESQVPVSRHQCYINLAREAEAGGLAEEAAKYKKLAETWVDAPSGALPLGRYSCSR